MFHGSTMEDICYTYSRLLEIFYAEEHFILLAVF